MSGQKTKKTVTRSVKKKNQEKPSEKQITEFFPYSLREKSDTVIECTGCSPTKKEKKDVDSNKPSSCSRINKSPVVIDLIDEVQTDTANSVVKSARKSLEFFQKDLPQNEKPSESVKKSAKVKKRVLTNTGRNKRGSLNTSREKKLPTESETITHYFSVRRSNRVPLSRKKVEVNEQIEKAILSKKDNGLTVVEYEDKGRGLVATCQYIAGEYVVEYAGELISHEDAKQRETEYQLKGYGCYMYYFTYHGKKYCVDATAESGRFGRLINHSMKKCNLKTKTFLLDGIPRLIFLAKRDINIGEELLYDYGERNKAAIEHHPWLTS